jgi:phosphatidylglycerophosphate synthase
MPNSENKSSGPVKNKPYHDYLNYFGKDRWLHQWFAEKRTKFVSRVFPPFVKIGLVPDTISYVGISLLSGVILYFVRRPLVAVLFLLGHVICDGMDGAYARNTGKASQSGAFTDLVCDQLGMVVVSLTAIFHHMVYPVLGAVYISLYLIVVVFGVIINVMGLGARITITSKYFLYLVYLIWACWKVNLFPLLMSFFSVIMAIEVVVGYLRLKRGIRRKFDTQVRFSEGDQYSGRLHYALNVAVPVSVLMAIFVVANWTPISSMLDHPKIQVAWVEGKKILSGDETAIGVGTDERDLYVMTSSPEKTLEIKHFSQQEIPEAESFLMPEYITPALTTFPVDDGVLLLADTTTRLLLGFDLKASFAAKQAVIVLTLPLDYLRVTAMSKGVVDKRTVWFAANYLYTRKTYIIDPVKAVKKGKLLGGIVGSYINAGFPSGMATPEGIVAEYNKSPVQSLIYVAPLKKLSAGRTLLDAATVSFAPPTTDALGPVIQGERLVMVTPSGQIYSTGLKTVLGSQGPGVKEQSQ